jgi:hypothetical protein
MSKPVCQCEIQEWEAEERRAICDRYDNSKGRDYCVTCFHEEACHAKPDPNREPDFTPEQSADVLEDLIGSLRLGASISGKHARKGFRDGKPTLLGIQSVSKTKPNKETHE